MNLTVLGLSITSSWGNGHATTFRALLAAFARRGHQVTFLERDKPWYAAHRDLSCPDFCTTLLYDEVGELAGRHRTAIGDADAVMIGSYVPEGVAVAEAVLRMAQGPVGFYDIDTPVTLAKLARGDEEYLTPGLIGQFAIYWSFTGGPTLQRLEREFGARRARPLYCTVDERAYRPDGAEPTLAMGYLGTYSADRQPHLERLLLAPARARPAQRFAVAGPLYPEDTDWPVNVERIEHVPPARHPAFYRSQRFTLNITRADMAAAGFAPSIRLFEAAAAGVPVISDVWPGIETFFTPGEEILLARSSADVLRLLDRVSEPDRRRLAAAARARVVALHTADIRAAQLGEDLCTLT